MVMEAEEGFMEIWAAFGRGMVGDQATVHWFYAGDMME